MTKKTIQKLVNKLVTENEPEEYNMSLDTAIAQKDDVKKLTDVNPEAEINIVQTEGEDEVKKGDLEDPDLFGDEEKSEREMDEGFDKVMQELEDKGKHLINIKENIKPRIKKKDLINYIKKNK